MKRRTAALLLVVLLLLGCSKQTQSGVSDADADGGEEHNVSVIFLAVEDSEALLSSEDARVVEEILADGDWIDDLTDCVADVIFIMEGSEELRYSSDCGTFNDINAKRSLTLVGGQGSFVNGMLARYGNFQAIEERTPLTVISGGETVKPYIHFAYSSEWTGEGFLAADGTQLQEELAVLADKPKALPELKYSQNIDFDYAPFVTFVRMQIFDENYEEVKSTENLDELGRLEAGKYYIGILVNERGRFIEEADQYEYSGNICVFCLMVE